MKITFLGAGSTVFAKNVLGDIMLADSLHEVEIALYDIDEERLKESETMLRAINRNCNEGRAKIESFLDRKEALRNANFVVNAIQVGGYKPCTVTDFEIPRKYGLKQTIGDTLGVAGIFRALRTIPVMLDFAKDMEEVCPDAWFLNYTNPMGMLTLAMELGTKIKTIGLCHSVQVCAPELLRKLGMDTDNVQYKIAGINHMAWLLEVTRNGEDLYPEIKRRAVEGPICKREYSEEVKKMYPQLVGDDKEFTVDDHDDLVRFEIMKQFGYYVTESSEHNAEYLPYFIKNSHPELIEKFNIPLDEYLKRCETQINAWKMIGKKLVENDDLTHTRTHEYASYIIEAIATGKPYVFGGNVLNRGHITNLPNDCCVEVPCVADRSGITPTYVGELPMQLAALNQTNVNVQKLTVQAALTKKKEYIYYAALLDPHTSSELTIDEIKALVDEMLEAHKEWLPEYK
ncbi:alpha-glucosidase/alpha-galactosidase [Clostridium sp. NSJ-6]|uniref:Alpha-glucosidase/alpha-galactosidase n=1 Tax=Clostridium hominis TaxID=2763036 RepID=A0ABR7D8M4_9CLOT|nr:alpha-glucosidase/alpha-galactosidase [Clostridium hominis]MBC5627673.1 alpha-glucosidase/alpha-galactosidase [Clostridium hominis]MDU2673070.1 alpha-glucosidase/alpha-galactosidase [Clostridium sp.]